MKNKKTTIGVIGGGNMGSAIIERVRAEHKILVCEKDLRKASLLKKKFRVGLADLQTTVRESRIIFLAVKPQDFDEIFSALPQHISKKQLVFSIDTGIYPD